MPQQWPEASYDLAKDTAAYPREAGTFDAEIMGYIDHHIVDEQHVLDEYQQLLEGSDHAPVRYLLGLLLEDEQRHHRILEEMLNQFRTATVAANHEPHVPFMSRRPDAETAATIRRLRREERKDLHQLRRLRRRLKFLRRHSLHGVLVDSLILDTRKHLRYLDTIQRLV